MLSKKELAVGQDYLIYGYKLKYYGEFASSEEANLNIPKEVGFYLVGENVYVRHFLTQKYQHLKNMSMKDIAKRLAEDRIVHKRPKTKKDVEKIEIQEGDNHPKIIIKNIINDKGLDIRDLRQKFQSDNHMNNMKRLLLSDVNMSWEKFLEWLEILDFDYSIDYYEKPKK